MYPNLLYNEDTNQVFIKLNIGIMNRFRTNFLLLKLKDYENRTFFKTVNY